MKLARNSSLVLVSGMYEMPILGMLGGYKKQRSLRFDSIHSLEK